MHVRETNPLPDGYHAQVTNKIERAVGWDEPGLYVIRLGLLTEPGYPSYDVSYCHGELHGEFVRVLLPFSELPRRGMRKAIVAHALRDWVYARGIGILDNFSTLD